MTETPGDEDDDVWRGPPPVLSISFEHPHEHAAVLEAAALAGRTPEAFIAEEIAWIAHMISTTGKLSSVKLARHHWEENRQFLKAFTASPSKREPIREWALRRAARPPAPSLADTRAWAETLHAEQTDAAGMPYAGHLARTAAHLARLFPEAGPAERHAVWLHDAMEDCGVTTEDLRARGYGDRVVAIVEAVTRSDRDQSYEEWIDGLAASGDAGAMRVKLADLADNADPARLAALPPLRALSLGQRYADATGRLRAALRRAEST